MFSKSLIVGLCVVSCAFAACVGKDAECYCDFVTSPICSDNSRVCQFPYFCIDGNCALSSDNSSCVTDNDCQDNRAVRGLGVSICYKQRCLSVGSYGDACSEDYHCRGNMKCSKKNHTCLPVPIGDKCDQPVKGPSDVAEELAGSECGPYAFCNKDGVCEDRARRFQECSNDLPCEDAAVCENGRCEEIFSLAEGAACNSSRACKKGLVCGSSGKCEQPKKVVYKTCTSDSDCGDGTTGKCVDVDAGNRYCETSNIPSKECSVKYHDLVKCLVKNECHMYVSSDLDSCGQQKCPDEVTAYFGCVDNCLKYQIRFSKGCISHETHRECPDIAPALLTVVEFSALAVIIFAVVLVYLVVKGVMKVRSMGKQ